MPDLETLVPNPNPKGVKDRVTPDYAEDWLREHGKTEKPRLADVKQLLHKVARRPKGKGEHIALKNQELEAVLTHGTYALISAGKNPNHEVDSKLSDAEIEARSKKMEQELIDGGYAYTRVKGHYGGEEDSFLVMVHDPDRKHVQEMGQKYNQDSVIYAENGKNEMLYTTGPNKGKRCVGVGHEGKAQAQDYFTEIEHPDGTKSKFALNFDFENLLTAALKKLKLGQTVKL